MKTIKIILALALLLGMGACSKDETTDTKTIGSSTIELTHGKSVVCSDASSFTLTPASGTTPEITVLKNTSTGTASITYNSIEGSATVDGCTQI